MNESGWLKQAHRWTTPVILMGFNQVGTVELAEPVWVLNCILTKTLGENCEPPLQKTHYSDNWFKSREAKGSAYWFLCAPWNRALEHSDFYAKETNLFRPIEVTLHEIRYHGEGRPPRQLGLTCKEGPCSQTDVLSEACPMLGRKYWRTWTFNGVKSCICMDSKQHFSIKGFA